MRSNLLNLRCRQSANLKFTQSSHKRFKSCLGPPSDIHLTYTLTFAMFGTDLSHFEAGPAFDVNLEGRLAPAYQPAWPISWYIILISRSIYYMHLEITWNIRLNFDFELLYSVSVDKTTCLLLQLFWLVYFILVFSSCYAIYQHSDNIQQLHLYRITSIININSINLLYQPWIAQLFRFPVFVYRAHKHVTAILYSG